MEINYNVVAQLMAYYILDNAYFKRIACEANYRIDEYIDEIIDRIGSLIKGLDANAVEYFYNKLSFYQQFVD